MTDKEAKIINNTFMDHKASIEKLIDVFNNLQTQVRKCTEDIAALTKRMDTYELHTKADTYNSILGACK